MANNNNQGLYPSMNPLSYMGVNPSSPSQLFIRDYAPTQNDSNALVGTIWLNFGQANPSAADVYMLVSKAGGQATWVAFGAIDTINGLLPINNDIEIAGGNGIVVNNAGNTITVASNVVWQAVPAATAAVQMVTNNNYTLSNAAGATVLTLPAVSALGDSISILQTAAGTFTIAQKANQKVWANASSTTTGVGGTVNATGTRVIIKIVCTTANLVWQVVESLGTTTYT